MRDENDGCVDFFLQVLHQAKNLGLNRDVQGRGRLVRNQNFRFASQGHSNNDSLPHPTRQLVGIFIDAFLGIGDFNKLQQFEHAFTTLGTIHGRVILQCFVDLPANGKHWVECGHGFLENHGDANSTDRSHHFLGNMGQVVTVEKDFAFFRKFAGVLRQESHDGSIGH